MYACMCVYVYIYVCVRAWISKQVGTIQPLFAYIQAYMRGNVDLCIAKQVTQMLSWIETNLSKYVEWTGSVDDHSRWVANSLIRAVTA